jgi:hypothetical protein
MQLLLITQAIYYLVTGLWALIDIDSFMAVTGPKTDLWMVKTISLLFISIGSSLLISFRKPEQNITKALGALTSFSTMLIDIYYSLNNVISKIYLADAGIQLLFLSGWIFYWNSTLKNN